jgi:hypothetical protein
MGVSRGSTYLQTYRGGGQEPRDLGWPGAGACSAAGVEVLVLVPECLQRAATEKDLRELVLARSAGCDARTYIARSLAPLSLQRPGKTLAHRLEDQQEG